MYKYRPSGRSSRRLSRFSSMKWPEVFLLHPGWDGGPGYAPPPSIPHQHLIAEVNSHIYCPGCVLCLSWEHNISSMPWVQTWTTNSLNWPVLIININFLCSHRHLGTFKLKGTVTSLHRKLTQCANVWVLKLGHKCIKVHENKNIHDSQFVMKLLIALQFQK